MHGEGMLFLYNFERIEQLIPLDMLFVDDDGVVRDIARETEPLSLDVISSRAPAVAVLEILVMLRRILVLRSVTNLPTRGFHPAFTDIW